MKSKIAIIFGLIVLTIVLLVISVKTWINKIDYGVADGFRIKTLGLKKVTILLPIYINNPTPFKIIVSDLDIDIYFDQLYISKIKTKGNYALLPKQYSTYPLEFQVATKDLIDYLANKGYQINDPEWKSNIEVTLDGNVTVDAGIFRLTNKDFKVVENLKSYVG